MAALNSIYVNCPVCGESLEVPVNVERVAHAVRKDDDLVVRATLFIAASADWDPSLEHANCFTLSDADLQRATAYFQDGAH